MKRAAPTAGRVSLCVYSKVSAAFRCLGPAFAALLFTTAASAEGAGAPASDPFTGYVKFMSNYVGRGFAESVGNPAIQGELDFHSASGFYANLQGSSINFLDQSYPGDSVSLELDATAGYRRPFAEVWLWKAGAVRFQFPGHYVPQSPPTDQPNTTEAFGFIGWKGLSAKLSYALTDSFAARGSRGSLYADLSASYPLSDSWTVGAHLGRKQARGTDPRTGKANSRLGYTDYELSLAYSFRPDVSLILAETWTNGDPAVFTVNGYAAGGHHLALILEKDF
ncbi:MAG TPA: TorF family putative porin [Gammaproteobacteria bacterium]|nr:TorF family putative porin [Gammaproteobacteria bacterium]